MNNFIISLLFIISCFTLQAQSSIDSSKDNSNENIEYDFNHQHSLGVSYTNFSGSFELNYELQISNKFSLRLGAEPNAILTNEYQEFGATAGFRYSFAKKRRMEFLVGLDYFYWTYDGGENVDSYLGEVEITRQVIEIPIEVKYHANENFSFNLSTSPGFLIDLDRSDSGTIEEVDRLNEVGRIRFGIQYNFGSRYIVR